MPLPLVVIEVPAQDRTAPETSALIAACTGALGGGRCELTQNRPLETVTAVAIVSWRDRQRLSALVEVARLHEVSEVWRTQELTFKPADQQIERFKTLGLAVAALFQEAQPPADVSKTSMPAPAEPPSAHQRRPTPGANEPPHPEPSSDRDEDEEAETRRRNATTGPSLAHPVEARLAAGAFAAYDPQLAWRYGGQLKLALGAAAFRGFVSVLGSYAVAQAPGGVSLRWVTLGFGPGVRLPLSPALELRGVARGLFVDVSGQASEPGRISRQDVWVPGASVELELGLHAGNRVALTLAGEVQQLAGNVPIQEHDQPTGTVGSTTLGVTLTLEWRLFGETGGGHTKMPE